jgi:hypothetical protein
LSNIAQQFIPGWPIISAEFKNLPDARTMAANIRPLHDRVTVRRIAEIDLPEVNDD